MNDSSRQSARNQSKPKKTYTAKINKKTILC